MSKILLVGQPNSGKSLLFNKLTGLQQKVANFPGVTVQVKSGPWNEFTLLDFPGSYSLKPLTQDEDVAVNEFNSSLKSDDVKLVLCVLDGTRLERSLFFALQILKAANLSSKKVIFCINMLDDLKKNKLSVDAMGISQALEIPVLTLSAKTGEGLSELYKMVQARVASPYQPIDGSRYSPPLTVSKNLTEQFGPKGDVLLKKINRFDEVFLSTIFGGIIFLAVMVLTFQAIFSWATPLMDATEWLVTSVGSLVGGFLPAGIVRDFISDAVFMGIGTFVVFVPQIFILTFIIGLLEDSGYLARVAIICHRPLRFFGLTGKSFIPFLSGHACAIPAIYATRMIESPKKRMVTLLTIPLISCSARLPIYALFVSALIPSVSYLGGLINSQGLVFFGLFILGYVVAMLVSSFYSNIIYKSKSDAPFIIELPPYRLPALKPLLLRSVKSSWEFLSSAGPVIFVVSVVVWLLGYFPDGAEHLETSYLASLGHYIEPLVRPFDLDWRYGVAVLTSFIAREVFVGTLGTLFGIQGAEDDVTGLAEKISSDGLTMASGVAMLVFYVIALQCVSTLATIRKETGSVWIPAAIFLFYGAIAYMLALGTYMVMV